MATSEQVEEVSKAHAHGENPTNKLHNAAPLETLLMTTPDPEAQDEGAALASKCLRELMDRHDVPRRKQSGVVTTVLGLSRAHGFRKYHGTYPMTLEELAKVGRHFGENLADVLRPALETPQPQSRLEAAMLLVGNLEVPCEIELGDVVHPPFDHKIVAIGAHDTWLVMPGTQVARPARQVKQIVMRDVPTPG